MDLEIEHNMDYFKGAERKAYPYEYLESDLFSTNSP